MRYVWRHTAIGVTLAGLLAGCSATPTLLGVALSCRFTKVELTATIDPSFPDPAGYRDGVLYVWPGQTVVFRAVPDTTGVCLDGEINYLWDYGDDRFSFTDTGNTEHRYRRPGYYLVKLQAHHLQLETWRNAYLTIEVMERPTEPTE